jgi:predicted amino acid racemase
MASLVIHTDRIIKNIKKLNQYLSKHDIKWTLVTKVLSGNRAVLEKILKSPIIKSCNGESEGQVHSIGDSRISNLRRIKKITDSDIVTMYIKPPPIKLARAVVEFADISLNTSLATIKALNEEAKLQNKIHRIIIMIELGELREGIVTDKIIDVYDKIFRLSNIKLIGLGTNLGCMYGIEPTYDKLVQLSLYKQLLETKFGRRIPLVSGGSSITLPLVTRKKIPKGVNHLRIGEAAFLGTSPLNNKRFRDLSTNAFRFYGNIIELEKKQAVPEGNISDANIGHVAQIKKNLMNRESHRAIVDFGMLDVDVDNLIPDDRDVKFIGITSDMAVYNLGDNRTLTNKPKYKVGDTLCFKPNYMAVARLMASRFIEKVVY